MNKSKLWYLILSILLLSLLTKCVPLDQQPGYSNSSTDKPYYSAKVLRTENFIYEPQIRTPLFYPAAEIENAVLGIPVLSLQENIPLKLEFDEIGNQYHNYYVRLLHCNADWTLSMLNDIEFLDSFNEFLITDYEISLNTRTPYIHYNFLTPKVKVSGNYVLVVYREGNKEDVVITRRFMAYDNRVAVKARVGFSTGIEQRYTHQQVDFSIDYSRYELVNPAQEVKVVIRQNNRWDNAIYNLKPMFVRDNERQLDYNFFNLENNFRGGNEFRIFDTRTIRFLGVGMERVQPAKDRIDVILQPDVTRNKEVYTQLPDINGRFVIENYETKRGATEADYTNVFFSLLSPTPIPGNVYVFGALSDWRRKKEFMLSYNEANNRYEGNTLLKQGYYNYIYMVEPSAGNQVGELHYEGSYSQTENFYDILVYYRPIGGRADQLIGYTSVNYMGR
jgi:hypothetical protein